MTSFPAEEPAQVQGYREEVRQLQSCSNALESDRVILGIQLPERGDGAEASHKDSIARLPPVKWQQRTYTNSAYCMRPRHRSRSWHCQLCMRCAHHATR